MHHKGFATLLSRICDDHGLDTTTMKSGSTCMLHHHKTFSKSAKTPSFFPPQDTAFITDNLVGRIQTYTTHKTHTMSVYSGTMHAYACTPHALVGRGRSLRALPRCQSNSSNSSSTRTTTKADALAELQALRQGLGQHLANTETALKSSAATEGMGAPMLCTHQGMYTHHHPISCAVSAPLADSDVLDIGSPENDLHEITAAQFDELLGSTDDDKLIMVKFTSSKCVEV